MRWVRFEVWPLQTAADQCRAQGFTVTGHVARTVIVMVTAMVTAFTVIIC